MTVIICADSPARMAVVRSPGRATAMPSAMVAAAVTVTGWPAASEPGIGATASACTPISRAPGSRVLAATAMPAASPPPPTGTTMVRTSGHCSAISRPTVPWPAITSGWSNG